MEDWEELYEAHEDNKARMDMEVEMFGEALNDDALGNELDALMALDAEAEMGSLGAQAHISDAKANRYREEHGLSANDPIPQAAIQQMQEEEEAPARQLIAA